jgi:hypothetical protein
MIRASDQKNAKIFLCALIIPARRRPIGTSLGSEHCASHSAPFRNRDSASMDLREAGRKVWRRTLQIINNAPYLRLSFLADFLLRNV